jgi:hypothetical protein
MGPTVGFFFSVLEMFAGFIFAMFLSDLFFGGLRGNLERFKDAVDPPHAEE